MPPLLSAGKPAISVVLDHLLVAGEAQGGQRLVHLRYTTQHLNALAVCQRVERSVCFVD